MSSVLQGPATRVIVDAVSASVIAGGAVSVQTNGKITERAFSGWADLHERRPITEDTVFRLASMTKPVIAVAVMQLVENGVLDLDDRISRFIPEFEHTTVRDLGLPFEMNFMDPRDPDVRALIEEARSRSQPVPAEREITVRDLLTHSSGRGQGAGSACLVEEAIYRSTTLAERVAAFAAIDADFQPGASAGYSALVGFDILGRIIEVVSGDDLETALRANLFEPLGMIDASFAPDAAQRARLAHVYERGDEGPLLAATSNILHRLIDGSPGVCSGSAGLFGTLTDYERFVRMLRSGGELDGVRVLLEESVTSLFSEEADARHSFLLGMRWGLGVVVVTGEHPSRAVGSWGWSGAFGTHFYIDPANGQEVVIMVSQADIGGAASPLSAAVEMTLLRQAADHDHGSAEF